MSTVGLTDLAFVGIKATEAVLNKKENTKRREKKDAEYLDRIRQGDWTAKGRFICRAIRN